MRLRMAVKVGLLTGLVGATLIGMPSTHAGSVRQDVYSTNGNSLDAWFDLGTNIGGVGYVAAGSGAFVGLNQAQDRGYILTAAHVVSLDANTIRPFNEIDFTIGHSNGSGFVSHYETTNVYVPNLWDPNDAEGGFRYDIAVVEVKREQSGNPGAMSTYIDTISGDAHPLYFAGNELGKRLVMSGVGGGGLSDGTELFNNGGRPSELPLAVSNTIDEFRYGDRAIAFDFDDPGNADGLNPLGGAEPIDNFEGLPVGGDSGSPIFIEDNGVLKIAAVTSFNSGGFGYGDEGGGTRLAPWESALLRGLNTDDWSAFVGVPEPSSCILLGLGLGVLASRRL